METETYATLKEKEDSALALADLYREQAENAQRIKVKDEGINGWRGYRFMSSSGLTQEFSNFSAQMRRELKSRLKGFELISYSRGHFYFSAFIKNSNTGKLVYISCDDVRFSPDGWFESLLIRTVEHDEDYTGGSNGFTSLDNLEEEAKRLTGELSQ